jgi:hypothetical protein
VNYLHYELEAGPDDVVEVTLSNAANVQLLDEPNFSNYKTGKPFRYTGGYAKTSPCRLSPPRRGRWHLVIDIGGYAGRLSASVAVRKTVHA